MRRWLASTWRRAVPESLAWVEAHRDLPRGRLRPATRVLVVYLVSTLTLVAMRYAVLDGALQRRVGRALGAWLGPGGQAYLPLWERGAWALGCFFSYFVIPALVTRWVLGHSLAEQGLTARGLAKHLKLYAFLFVPVGALVLCAAQADGFQRQYPFYRNPLGTWDLVVWECFYALQFFGLEYFFRGFMLHGVKDVVGPWAILVMVMPYTMIHFQKPLAETLGAVVAGLVLGLLSLRTRNIWGGVFIHVLVAVSMDLAALSQRE